MHRTKTVTAFAHLLLLFSCSPCALSAIRYGRIERVDLKLGQRPPGFAFVEYTSSSAAYDAVKGRDGYDFYGSKLRVSTTSP